MSTNERIERTWESFYNTSTLCRREQWDDRYMEMSFNGTSNGSSAKILATFTAVAGYNYRIEAEAICSNGTGNYYGAFKRTAGCRVNATGTLVLNGTVVANGTDRDSDATNDFTMTVNGTTLAVNFVGNGGLATYVLYWSGHARILRLNRSTG